MVNMRNRPFIVFVSVLLLIICVIHFYLLATHLENNRGHFLLKSFDMETEEGLLEYISSWLEIRYTVLSNTGFIKYQHEVALTNLGKETIRAGEWSIYFSSIHMVKNVRPKRGQSSAEYYVKLKFAVHHMDGGHFKLTPTSAFQGLEPGATEVIRLQSAVTAARCYVFPHWYVASPGYSPATIRSTDDESLSFVNDFDAPHLYKRTDRDYSKPFSPQERFARYNVTDLGKAPMRILPTPLRSTFDENHTVDLSTGEWKVCGADEFSAEASRFADLFNLALFPSKEPCPPSHAVTFVAGEVEDAPPGEEAYEIIIKNKTPAITITASGPAGAFYATQTLLSMTEGKGEARSLVLPVCEIKDSPRFGYRGLHIDVARNFIGADDVIRIIEAMAMYKLNKLHLHLTDDEAWRLEIPDLPELTQVGAVRGHTQNEATCLFPALGSGPFTDKPGSGFYSVAEYKTILVAAAANHIEVIPEVDMPGHSHAAMKAMEARYYRLMQGGNINAATEYLLTDFNDESPAKSVQHFRNNAMNPCMPSTMRFVEKVIDTIIDLHADVQPIGTLHVGGDEVATNSWRDSPVCENFIAKAEGFPNSEAAILSIVPTIKEHLVMLRGCNASHRDLQEHFMRQVAGIISKKGLSAGVWEESAVGHADNAPIDKKHLHDVDVIAYAWNNIWGGNNADRAHKLANAGYKVVMSMGTHLYFDHPQEPDPEEIGLFWATRYADDRMVFDFMPDDLHSNAKYDYHWAPFSAEDLDNIRDTFAPLARPENVIGMQAQLWSELIRDVSVAHSQLFPRLIAFAERAWHQADWEVEKGREARHHRAEDWEEFANVVGYKELARLKSRRIRYRVPPPGFRFANDTIEIGCLYPGLAFKHRTVDSYGETSKWGPCVTGQTLSPGVLGHEFVTSDGERTSRVIKYKEKTKADDEEWWG